MNAGFHMAAAGVLTSFHKQDVYANNLANLNTAGFKPDVVVTRVRPAERVEDQVSDATPHELLERLNGGVFLAPSRVDFAQGDVETTGNPLDVAIAGEGFLVVQANGGSDVDRVRLTRDGRLTVRPDGRLVTHDGMSVLDPGNQPITLPSTLPPTISRDGVISQNGAPVGRIQLSSPQDLRRLEKVGAGAYRASANMLASLAPATGTLQQGALERSRSDPVRAMTDMMSSSHHIAVSTKILQIYGDLMQRAVGVFGRLA